jgi:hypothetical protein
MQKVNVSHVKTKFDKVVRRRELPCVRHSKSLYRGRAVCCVVVMSMERKSDEEAKKKQRKRICGQWDSLSPKSELEIQYGCNFQRRPSSILTVSSNRI